MNDDSRLPCSSCAALKSEITWLRRVISGAIKRCAFIYNLQSLEEFESGLRDVYDRAPKNLDDQELDSIASALNRVELENIRLRDALQLIATHKRPDGTYNRSREACEQLAKEALEGK